MTIAGFQQHIGSIYQHITYLHVKRYQRWRTGVRPADQVYYNPTLTKNQQVYFASWKMYFCHNRAKERTDFVQFL